MFYILKSNESMQVIFPHTKKKNNENYINKSPNADKKIVLPLKFLVKWKFVSNMYS